MKPDIISDRKGQSAIEYLSTYGWALLAIVIVGAVLLQMGVFDQCSQVTPRFTGQEFDVEDFDYTSEDSMDIAFVAIEDTVTVENITLDYGGGDVYYEDDLGVDISPGETEVITLDGIDDEVSSGECASADMEVTYNAGPIEGRTALGEGQLTARVP